MSQLDLRASDGDRERTVEQLRAHASVGRLTVEELEERVQRAFAARTVGELAELTRDLPEHRPPPARDAPRRRRPRRPELGVFASVMVLLIAIWALTGAGYFWPVWPLIGWGFFVLSPHKGLGFPACRPSGLWRR
jgi:Domain of unknown function (DUF1707)/2TM domain